MTAQTAIPLKWYVPFAQNDSSRVEIPVTTPDATRASQSLGFPPLTMQPPESGGVPPQGEDFNGGMNQVARVCWWVLNGGGWPFDATFATNSNINGYPNGAKLQAADFAGDWLNTIDNNQNNPDTTGTNWVPGYVYGNYALTGQTGGTTTLAPSAAKFKSITITGTLASALTVVLPAWLYDWTITNNTTGAFVTIVKTLAGSGVTIPQNGSPTRVTGDGTNITQPAANVATAINGTQPARFDQVSGVVGSVRNLKMTLTAASQTGTLTADEIVVETALGGLRYCLASFNKTINLATTGAGGMDTGTAPVSGYVALYAIYNPTTQASALLATNATSAVQPNVYGGSAPVAGYTASALVAVWPTDSTGKLTVGHQRDRRHYFPLAQAFSTGAPQSYASVSIAGVVPPNAVSFGGTNDFTGTSGVIVSYIAGDSVGTGEAHASFNGGQGASSPFRDVPIITPQTVYRALSGTGATQSVSVSEYDI